MESKLAMWTETQPVMASVNHASAGQWGGGYQMWSDWLCSGKGVD